MYISGRGRKIIEYLLSIDGWITIKEIAELLKVSTRTIHRDLDSIKHTLHDYNLNLKKRTGMGIKISGDNADRFALKQVISNVTHTDFTPAERQAIILATLLEMNEPIKLFTLANELNVTIATISDDLDQLETELCNQDLSLIRRRGFGVKVEGNEASKRAALSNLITTYFDTFDFVALLKENIQKKSNEELNTLSNRLLGLVNPQKLSTIEQVVDSIRSELPYDLADSAYIGLIVHLALAIERLEQGDIIKFDQAYMKQIKGTTEFEIANKVIRELEKAFQMNIPNDEIGYITMHLKGAKLRIDQNYLIEESSLDTAYKAKELIQYVGKEMDVNLVENTALLKDLVAHLKPTIYRLKQGMNINNPLIEEIKKNYQDLFLLIREGVRVTFTDISFPEDEIGYLVLHFAAVLLYGDKNVNLHALVVCASGIGTAKILAMKLMQQFPEIKRVDNISLFELRNYDTASYDVIVSTTPLKEIEQEYILASPILTKGEVHNIKKALRQKKLSLQTKAQRKRSTVPQERSPDTIERLETVQYYTTTILDLLTNFQVYKLNKKRSFALILDSICRELKEKRVIDNELATKLALLKREQIGGLGIPNTSLALYHTRSDVVLKPSFTIYSLSEPITVQGMDKKGMAIDTILLMVAPKQASQETLAILSYLSSLIIQSETSVELFTTGSELKIKQFLSEQFHRFLNEQNIF